MQLVLNSSRGDAAPQGNELDRLIPWAELRTIIPLSRVAVWQARRRGEFPAPVKVSTNRIAWRLSEIRAWMDSRLSA